MSTPRYRRLGGRKHQYVVLLIELPECCQNIQAKRGPQIGTVGGKFASWRTRPAGKLSSRRPYWGEDAIRSVP
jgi:hypothetical protein